ncbi:MAG: hypothetical protein HY899_17965 [Deltaproteobacteria bacterium]|nr:hypothetical protein [Deltaproteobacteria bacterium]
MGEDSQHTRARDHGGDARTQAGDLRKFATRALALAALVVAGHAAVLLMPVEKSSYLSAVIDKQARLGSLPSPKLVFVGGSNLSFAVDSARVEREMGMPVVNMGLGIYAGLRFMLDSVAPRLGSGDLVVISAEYQLYRGLYNGEDELLEVLEAFPEGLRTVDWRAQAFVLARALPTYIKNKANRLLATVVQAPDPHCVYCRRAFNQYGDLIALSGQPGKDVATMAMFRSKGEQGPIEDEAIRGLRRFVADAGARGARVVLMFPAVPAPLYEKNRAKVDEVYERVKKDVAVAVLGAPSENTMPAEYFWDWVYHLVPAGRDVRTGVILQRLKAYLAASAARDAESRD